MRHWTLLTVAVFALGLSVPAQAGSISDFKDSVSGQSSSSSDDDDDSSSGGYDNQSYGEVIGADCREWADDPEDCANYSPVGANESDVNLSWLFGVRPGWELSLGTAPYHGRYISAVDGFNSDGRARASRGYQLEMAGDYRLNQFTARASGLATTAFDGGGLELFVKHTSTQTPGLAVKYARLHDFENGERLGLLRPTYEPNLLIDEAATLSLNLGWSMMLDQGGIFVHGPSAGMGLEVFPIDPLMFEVRGGLDVMSGAMVPHIRGAFGIFATDRLAIEASAQHMQVAGGAGLSTIGLGVRFYQGW